MLTRINLGEMVKVEGRVIAVKKFYDDTGKVKTSYTIEIPKLGKVEYDENEIMREAQS